jgi:hypothetical protein
MRTQKEDPLKNLVFFAGLSLRSVLIALIQYPEQDSNLQHPL